MHRAALRVLSVTGALALTTALVAAIGERAGDPALAATSGIVLDGRTVAGEAAVADADDRHDAHRVVQQAATATAQAAEKAAIAERRAEAARKAEAERQARAEAEARKAREAERARIARAASRDPRGLGRAMAADRGWTGSQWSCLESLWTKESNWKVTADNPTSSAYGIPQALPGSKMSSAGGDWRTNPATQIAWGLGYIADRYGSPCSAWSHSKANNWY